MTLLGQSHEISHMANLYLYYLSPSLWALACSACIQNWLHCQSKTRAAAIITFITAILHPLWCYLLIYYFNIGYIGAAISISITKFIELTLLIIYIKYISNIIQEVQFSFHLKESCNNWWSFLRLGLPNLLMMSEWWASEAIIFMSGSLNKPENQVSAMSIYQSIVSICFMIPLGFSVSGNTRVGNALGMILFIYFTLVDVFK
jgi:MATE family multidrug resistance protein